MNITRYEMGPRFSEMTVVDLGTAKLIYLAGQVAQNTSLDVSGQTREVLQYIDQLLAKAGATKTDIVAARIYLGSTGDYAVMNAIWDDWVVPGHTPARTTVGSRLVNLEYKVEIEVTAAINS
ncbi:RidA family protein [Solimicrobium silvestre]|uniref:Putative translation initiation inhibitor yjgF family n=1 Tax=Solimicrobium silvestre TaxID=2099400 RepID=A0A2S9H151_9BURK|nr:RidA family protein [Solimicrobium silvestre]PRC93712.1 putative translation initiation inhibitor yjgF family [Solimicrobium silvestre]